ncbi:hypothetical protein SNEBB_007957 [Seison nebaliae]|nr:hypothetical protein SNEBB_007957 [Seison nebaliae]
MSNAPLNTMADVNLGSNSNRRHYNRYGMNSNRGRHSFQYNHRQSFQNHNSRRTTGNENYYRDSYAPRSNYTMHKYQHRNDDVRESYQPSKNHRDSFSSIKDQTASVVGKISDETKMNSVRKLNIIPNTKDIYERLNSKLSFDDFLTMAMVKGEAKDSPISNINENQSDIDKSELNGEMMVNGKMENVEKDEPIPAQSAPIIVSQHQMNVPPPTSHPVNYMQTGYNRQPIFFVPGNNGGLINQTGNDLHSFATRNGMIPNFFFQSPRMMTQMGNGQYLMNNVINSKYQRNNYRNNDLNYGQKKRMQGHRYGRGNYGKFNWNTSHYYRKIAPTTSFDCGMPSTSTVDTISDMGQTSPEEVKSNNEEEIDEGENIEMQQVCNKIDEIDLSSKGDKDDNHHE